MPPRRSRRAPGRTESGQASGVAPPLTELERFSTSSLARWKAAGLGLAELNSQLFFGLEKHRAGHADELVDAIRSALTGPLPLDGWQRLVDYRYSNAPLSSDGSLTRDGGRFNIGQGLNPSTYTPFPALYTAEDFETAWRERFGIERSRRVGGLTADELVLRRASSFTSVTVRGSIETVFDVGDLDALRPVARILATFKLPATTGPLARSLGVPPPGLVRSASGLQRQLLHPDWRQQPAQYDLPANSQIFGRLCVAAGVHGILYPSTKAGSRHCLALFTQNWAGSSSFIELIDAAPTDDVMTRIDGADSVESSREA